MAVAVGVGTILISMHGFMEGVFRPARAAIVGETGIGDSLPRSRPTFANWTNLSMTASIFLTYLSAAMPQPRSDVARHGPLLAVAMACALTVRLGGAVRARSLVLARAEDRYVTSPKQPNASRPAISADGCQLFKTMTSARLGTSFNRMQAGLAERQRLQAAFGTYVDPVLATRLLEQGDDVFSGERRDVTVMFVDIRDFTPFAESNSAEDTVSRLNALFDIVVPAVVEAGGHVNKFLGDGALAGIRCTQ